MRFRDGCCPLLPAGASLALLLTATFAPAAENPGTVKPFPEAKVIKRSVRQLEAYWIPLGKLFGDGQAEKYQVVEGKWTHVTYSNPAKSSVIEIGRRYDQQLREAGYEIVYDCRDGDCGSGGRKTNGDWWDPNFQRRYLVGRLERAEGDLWACIHVQAKGPNLLGQHDVDVIEAKPEPREQKVARDETDAGWLEQELNESGHVAIYRIRFDEKRFTVLPGSDPALKAISQLLARDPRRRLLVVVHTDDVSNWKTGLQRSRKQAAALVSTLIKKHGAPASRLAGDGVGPLAPQTTNPRSEENVRNSRVEVVLAGPAGSALKAQGSQE
jgi:OOP family OmpA-OmpF porin